MEMPRSAVRMESVPRLSCDVIKLVNVVSLSGVGMENAVVPTDLVCWQITNGVRLCSFKVGMAHASSRLCVSYGQTVLTMNTCFGVTSKNHIEQGTYRCRTMTLSIRRFHSTLAAGQTRSIGCGCGYGCGYFLSSLPTPLRRCSSKYHFRLSSQKAFSVGSTMAFNINAKVALSLIEL